MRKVILTALLGVSSTFAMPLMDSFEEVKRFPYITYKEVWTGTPAQSEDVSVPNVQVVYGRDEDREVIAKAANIAFYLGQWTQSAGLTPKAVKKAQLPSFLVSDTNLKELKGKNLIVVGTKNRIVKELKLSFNKPTLKVVRYKGAKVLVVGGKNREQVLKAVSFLADRVISFKAGAYKTFFSFVKLRGLIEKEQFTAAIDLIENPEGLSACGRNMSLAAPMMAKFKPDIKKVVKKRNRIMYKELKEALIDGDKERAVKLWKEAMFTCYQCHQGIGIPKVRKFKPLGLLHSKHQRIAEGFGLVRNLANGKDCSACHTGDTQYRGY